MTPPAKRARQPVLPDRWGIVMLLADSAVVSEGKIFMLGGGWSITSAPTPPFAVVVKIEVPWNETNERHTLSLELLNDDYTAVTISSGEQEVALVATGQFEMGRPPGVAKGTALDLPIVFSFQSLNLQPDHRYVWRLSIDASPEQVRTLVFSTRPKVTA